jgi:hypothetical protein
MINELKDLESTGLELNIDGKNLQVKVVVGVFTGDNLFLNGIMGFVESFTAHKPCRVCTVDRNEFQKMLIADDKYLRTVETYTSATENINIQQTGIKQNSVLNELKYFHVVTNCCQDIMHDLFEGVLVYDMMLICNGLVREGHMKIDQLNHQIQTFDYGYHDATNKPPVINLAHDVLPFDAGQAWCLMRILGIAVGHLVPEDDPIWHFYNSLRDIVDIILAPSVSDMQLDALPVMICEYMEQHLRLFPSVTIKNKHHHLTHYATLTRRIGPLVRFSCMRFESKHQRSKKLLHVAGNFKNVPKSCAYRHQHDVAFTLLQVRADVDTDLVIGTGSVITLSELQNGFEINSCLGNVGMWSEVYAAKWIELRGIKYKPSVVVHSASDKENLTPSFIEVEHIIIHKNGNSENNVWFVGEKYTAVYFNSHFHSWCVERQVPAQIVSLDARSLVYYTPLIMHTQLYKGDRLSLVSPRYHI